MNEESKPTDTPVTKAPAPASLAGRLAGWLPVFVLCGTFLLGFAPMWLKSNRLNKELIRAQREARLEQIQIAFADAALDARRGDYEPARQRMASFFRLVAAEMDRSFGSALPDGAAAELKPLLAQRDDLITLLARGDPASAERLAIAYANFRKTLGK
jgi:hypothetical protein